MGFIAMAVDWSVRQHLLLEEHKGNKKFMLQDLYLHYLFNMFRSLVIQGNRIKSPSSSTRLILGLWFLISLIIYALYSGTLCAVFAAPSYMDPINSLPDLLQAARERNVYPIVTAGTAISYLFEQAAFGTHKEIYRYFDPAKSRAGYDERYSQAAKGRAVIMSSSISNIIKSNIYGRDKYHIGTEQFFFQSYGIALSNGSPMKFIFSKTLQRLIEGGFILKWVKEGVNNELRYNNIIHGDRGNLVSRGRSDNKPISLIQLQAAFFILVLGFFLALIAFFLEISYFKLA